MDYGLDIHIADRHLVPFNRKPLPFHDKSPFLGLEILPETHFKGGSENGEPLMATCSKVEEKNGRKCCERGAGLQRQYLQRLPWRLRQPLECEKHQDRYLCSHE
jgi:hypothetical protein